MHDVFARLFQGVPVSGTPCPDMAVFLAHHGYTATLEHSHSVAAEAERLAIRFDADHSRARAAGCLHDVSAVFPVAQRASVARALGLDILPEEESAPLLLHQKLSAVMAQEVFGVTDNAVLSAIECHTTLKAGASTLDKVVFVADKVAWDQPGAPPYSKEITQALHVSLDNGAMSYLEYLWQRRASLQAIHPWFVDAYLDLQHGTAAPLAR